MNLDQAIKKIINDHGADILKERRLVSMLSDLQAFGQLPYAANMLRQIYANGYGTKIHQLYCSQDQTEVAAFLSELRNKLGFDGNMLGKVLYAFSLPVQRAGVKQKKYQNDSIQKQKNSPCNGSTPTLNTNPRSNNNLGTYYQPQTSSAYQNKQPRIYYKDEFICNESCGNMTYDEVQEIRGIFMFSDGPEEVKSKLKDAGYTYKVYEGPKIVIFRNGRSLTIEKQKQMYIDWGQQ